MDSLETLLTSLLSKDTNLGESLGQILQNNTKDAEKDGKLPKVTEDSRENLSEKQKTVKRSIAVINTLRPYFSDEAAVKAELICKVLEISELLDRLKNRI